jgi:hypothetical protein
MEERKMITRIEKRILNILLCFMMLCSLLMVCSVDTKAATNKITLGTSVSVALNGKSQKYTFTPTKSDYYKITADDVSDDANVVFEFSHNGINNSVYINYFDTIALKAKQEYTITVSSENTVNFKFKITEMTYSEKEIKVGDAKVTSTYKSNNLVRYKFTPTKTAFYKINTTETYLVACLYDKDKNLIMYDDFYPDYISSDIPYSYKANTTYYITYYNAYYGEETSSFKWNMIKAPEYDYNKLSNNTYSFKGYYGNNKTLNIPSTYNGKAVTQIESARIYNATVINIPASVTSLEYGALSHGDYTAVNFAAGSKLKKIGSNAFTSDTKLKKITIPEGVTTIEANAFNACTNLKQIELPKTIKSIGNKAIGIDSDSYYLGIAAKNITGITIYGYSGNKAITEYVKANSHVKFVAYKLMSDKSVKATAKNFTYTGKTATPSVTVKYGSTTLKKGTDYTVTTTGKATGKQTLTITGIGKYRGTKKVTYYIVPKKVSTPKVTVAKKSATVKITKVSGASGYEIAYRVKGTSKYKTVTTTSLTKKLTKLTSKKQYEIKVRAYKTVNKKKYYGAYSSIKTTSKIK